MIEMQIQHRDMSAFMPMATLAGISPICVPLSVDEGFAEEIGERYSTRVYSLWKRLNLFYLEEAPVEPMQEKSATIVNQFTQQIFLQLFSEKNISRLIQKNQPGFVLYNNVLNAKKGAPKTSGAANRAAAREIFTVLREKQALSEGSRALISALKKDTAAPDRIGGDTSAERAMLTVAIHRLITEISEEKRISEENRVMMERLLIGYEEKHSDTEATAETRPKMTAAVHDLLAAKTNEQIVLSSQKALELTAASTARMSRSYSQLADEILRMERAGRTAEEIRTAIPSVLRRTSMSRPTEQAGTPRAPHETEQVIELFERIASATVSGTIDSEYDQVERTSTDMIEILRRRFDGMSAGEIGAELRRAWYGEGSSPKAITNEVLHTEHMFSVATETLRLMSNTVMTEAAHAAPLLSTVEPVAAVTAGSADLENTSAPQGRTMPVDGYAETMPPVRLSYIEEGAEQAAEMPRERIVREEGGRETREIYLTSSDRAAMRADMMRGAEQAVQSIGARLVGYIEGKAVSSPAAKVGSPAVMNAAWLPSSGSAAYPSEAMPVPSNGMAERLRGRVARYVGDALAFARRSGMDYSASAEESLARFLPLVQAAPAGIGQTSASVNFPQKLVPSPYRDVQMLYAAVNADRDGGPYRAAESHHGSSASPARVPRQTTGGGEQPPVAPTGRVVPMQADTYSSTDNIYNIRLADGIYNESTLYRQNLDRRVGHGQNSIQTPYHMSRRDRTEQRVSQATAAPAVTGRGTVIPPALGAYETKARDGVFRLSPLTATPARPGYEAADLTAYVETEMSAGGGMARVLPLVKESFLMRDAERYFAERSAAETAAEDGKRADAVLRGSVIPARQNSHRTNLRLVMPEAGNSFEGTPEAAAREAQMRASRQMPSYRKNLDEKTLQALDRMIAAARPAVSPSGRSAAGRTDTGVIRAEWGERLDEAEIYLPIAIDQPIPSAGMALTSPIRTLSGESLPEMRMVLHHLTRISKIKKATTLTENASVHISRLIDRASTEEKITTLGEHTTTLAANSNITFRTIDDGENMVMLVPPVEADRFRAESGYLRDLPPIDFRRQQKEASPSDTSARKPEKPTLNEKMEKARTVKTEVRGSFEDMSREDIAKLADKVYAQIESRIARERRRSGF